MNKFTKNILFAVVVVGAVWANSALADPPCDKWIGCVAPNHSAQQTQKIAPPTQTRRPLLPTLRRQ